MTGIYSLAQFNKSAVGTTPEQPSQVIFASNFSGKFTTEDGNSTGITDGVFQTIMGRYYKNNQDIFKEMVVNGPHLYMSVPQDIDAAKAMEEMRDHCGGQFSYKTMDKTEAIAFMNNESAKNMGVTPV